MSGAGGRPEAVRVGPMAAEAVAADAGAAVVIAAGDASARDPARRLAPEIGAAGRRDREARRQQAIRDVLAVSAGLPLGEITAELRRALALHGVGPQPEAWLDAVGSDVALGNIYVVSEQAMADTGSVLPRAADEGGGTGDGGRDLGPT